MNLINIPTTHQVETCEEAQANWGMKLRSSRHSLSGYVLDLWFALQEEAGAFAGRWAQEVGGTVKVRKVSGGLFKVSVPVQSPSF